MLCSNHVVSAGEQFSVDSIRRFSRAEYDRLVEQGWFTDERLELIEGLLVTVSPQGTSHADVIAHVHELLVRLLGDRASVRSQLPFAATDDSEPEPDVAVVVRARYRDEHPRAAFLIIEVADSSLPYDRYKASVYAAASVPEYWIVDLNAARVVVHLDPDPETGAYRTTREHGSGDVLHPTAFPDLAIAVADLL